MADALLRSLGGSVAMLRMPVAASSAIGEQLGAPTAGFVDLPLSPAAFRKVRVPIIDGNQASYELLISASAVEAQVTQLQTGDNKSLLGSPRLNLRARQATFSVDQGVPLFPRHPAFRDV